MLNIHDNLHFHLPPVSTLKGCCLSPLHWPHRRRRDPVKCMEVQDHVPFSWISAPGPGSYSHLLFPKAGYFLMHHSPSYYFLSNCLKASIQATKLKISQNLPIMKVYKSFTCKLLIKAIPTVSRIYCWWILGQKANSLAVLLLSP